MLKVKSEKFETTIRIVLAFVFLLFSLVWSLRYADTIRSTLLSVVPRRIWVQV